ncbi:MAG: class 1 fructose-bisphosphatase [Polyangiales bacterium]
MQSQKPAAAREAAGSLLGITLEQHVATQMAMSPGATGHFTSLLYQIALAAKLVDSRVRQAGLADVLGYTGDVNVQGERVQKLDELANETFITVLRRGGRCCAIASEELEDALFVEGQGRYAVTMDPLDGSSNIDCNVSIGTIFGVYRRRTDPMDPSNETDLLQPGSSLRAAGYVIYGSSTMLVYSTGQRFGVHGFTLDPTIGEFFLSHEDIKVPTRGNTFSINEGNSCRWDESTRKWVEYLKQEDKESKRPYGARYVGSLVADAHRTLLKGGIFAYPADKKSPQGKLRLLYEANPFSFIFEAAGGKASDGKRRILDIPATTLHQRTPLVLGSAEDVAEFERFAKEAP